jgi:hypothetical protein
LRSHLQHQIAFAKAELGHRLYGLDIGFSHLELDWQSSVWRPLLEALGASIPVSLRSKDRLTVRDLGADLDAFVADMKAVADASKLDKFPISL